MWTRIAAVPGIVVALAALGLGVVSGLVTANMAGHWVSIYRTGGSGPICSRPPCSPAPIVVSPSSYAIFTPNGDVGLAVGLVVAILVVAVAIRARRIGRAAVSR